MSGIGAWSRVLKTVMFVGVYLVAAAGMPFLLIIMMIGPPGNISYSAGAGLMAMLLGIVIFCTVAVLFLIHSIVLATRSGENDAKGATIKSFGNGYLVAAALLPSVWAMIRILMQASNSNPYDDASAGWEGTTFLMLMWGPIAILVLRWLASVIAAANAKVRSML